MIESDYSSVSDADLIDNKADSADKVLDSESVNSQDGRATSADEPCVGVWRFV